MRALTTFEIGDLKPGNAIFIQVFIQVVLRIRKESYRLGRTSLYSQVNYVARAPSSRRVASSHSRRARRTALSRRPLSRPRPRRSTVDAVGGPRTVKSGGRPRDGVLGRRRHPERAPRGAAREARSEVPEPRGVQGAQEHEARCPRRRRGERPATSRVPGRLPPMRAKGTRGGPVGIARRASSVVRPAKPREIVVRPHAQKNPNPKP
jgi:hypothetical protein